MKALTWHGVEDVRVDEHPDPSIEQADDVIVRITSSGLCGSDLHLYTVLKPFLDEGDILGHEPMGIVEEVGPEVTELVVGDRVVIPFNVSCGDCWMCGHGLHSQCETTQVHEYGTGASFFGYTKLYGQVPGGQAELLRVPFGNRLPIKVPEGPADDRYLFLSDVLPTAWQGVEYAQVPDGGTVGVMGLGPIGDMAMRVAAHRGYRPIGVDLVPERLERARARGYETIDLNDHDDDLAEVMRAMTDGRGPDSVIDAVGMEAHGNPAVGIVHKLTGMLPDAIGEPMMQKAGVSKLAALYQAIDCVRRGGTISISGVYGGAADPLPTLQLFDKQITIKQGQANVRYWTDTLLPLLTDDDPLGVDTFATHHISLADAPQAYSTFQKKEDGAVKIVFNP